MTNQQIISVMVEMESRGDVNAIGDLHLEQKAYGPLQIRQPAVDDVNRRFGTTYKAEDMLGNMDLSEWVFWRYMDIYATEKRLGHKPTIKDYAGIWNGGPNGYKNELTKKYREKVSAIAAKRGLV